MYLIHNIFLIIVNNSTCGNYVARIISEMPLSYYSRDDVLSQISKEWEDI